MTDTANTEFDAEIVAETALDAAQAKAESFGWSVTRESDRIVISQTLKRGRYQRVGVVSINCAWDIADMEIETNAARSPACVREVGDAAQAVIDKAREE